jgi:transmembrane sensor
MSPERLDYLIDRFFAGTCTQEEKQELAAAVDHPPAGDADHPPAGDADHPVTGDADHPVASDEILRIALEKAWMQHEPGSLRMPEEMSDRILQSLIPTHRSRLIILRGTRRSRLIILRGTRKWWMAAAAVFLVGSGIYLLGHPPRKAAQPLANNQPPAKDIAPGGNRAFLTLGNGQKIMLDSADNGILAQQGNATVTKLSNGQVAYATSGTPSRTSASPSSPTTLYNTMSTPAGGQYRLSLPDGTRVWLNSSSSITYPVAFTGTERHVRITGEAYFEVTKNIAMPFRVATGNTSVYVLGTSFNISAYTDETSINTTLVEGVVRIGTDKGQKVLAPGQQGQVAPDGGIKWEPHANVEQAVAWKNGIFSFRDADIRTIMRQLSRWYNVEVSYAGALPAGDFSGEIGRSLTLTQVLNGLSQEKVHYRIETGNKIVILP